MKEKLKEKKQDLLANPFEEIPSRARIHALDSQDVGPQFGFLRESAIQNGVRITKYGSLAVTTNTRSRRAQDTKVIWGDPSQDLLLLLEKYVRQHPMFELARLIAPTENNWRSRCRLLISQNYPHIPLYWGSTLFDDSASNEFLTISVPEWEDQQILVFPDHRTTILLGTDYVGEHKMSFLRLLMYQAFVKGALGCHAASKIIRVREKGGLRDAGLLIFGLSKTGKTTLTTHSHGLKEPERVFVPQDDIVIFTRAGKAIGTEQNFYVTTEGLSQSSHPEIWQAAASPRALLENVYINEQGAPDFLNTSITQNGRAVIQRQDLRYAADAPLDVERIDFIFFITRRNDIIPPLVRLSPQWAALTFLLGESVQTAAGDPSRAGETIRVPGLDPFMIVDPALATNRFYELLVANPHIQCFLLNTGTVGEKEKIYPQESARMIEMVVRNQVVWQENSVWGSGYTPATTVPGIDTKRLLPESHYDQATLEAKQEALRRDRWQYLEQFTPHLPAALGEVINH